MSNDEKHLESKNSRALHLFESAIKSEATKVQYKLIVSKFLDWTKVDDVDNFVAQDQKKLQILIEDYVIYLKTKSGLSPNSIPRQFFALQLLFAMNDVILNWVKIRKLLPAAVKLSGEHPYTNDHLRMMLSNSKIPHSRALIHFTASTGCRIGAIPDLKIKHLTKMEDGCTAVTEWCLDMKEDPYDWSKRKIEFLVDKINPIKDDKMKTSPGQIWSIKKLLVLDYCIQGFVVIFRKYFEKWVYVYTHCGTGLIGFEEEDLHLEHIGKFSQKWIPLFSVTLSSLHLVQNPRIQNFVGKI